MARRKKGRNISGWLVLDKPAGWTSSAAVNKVRWAFDAKKAGHAGTLDPAATGVLAIALGEATKTVPYITDALKAYRFTIRLGQGTNTDDGEGDILATSETRPSDAQIVAALPDFVGDITQVPPKFSAVKIDGQRAYKLARGGHEVQLSARPLYVEDLVLVGRPDPDHAELEMVCGKGGYVRAIARDLGETLGCFAHVVALRRIWSGPFDVRNGISLEDIEALAGTPDIDELLMPLECGLHNLPELTCDAAAAARLRNGNPALVLSSNAEYGDQAWASHQGTPIAVGIYRSGELHPHRVFNL